MASAKDDSADFVVCKSDLKEFQEDYYNATDGRYDWEMQVPHLVKLADGYLKRYETAADSARDWTDLLKMSEADSTSSPTAEKSQDLEAGDNASDSKIESIPSELDIPVKHPLQNTWALWYFKNDRSKDWNENLKIVAKFHFVEDFWALYNHIQPASKLNTGCDYSMFKDGIKPAWEDERNRNGGRWLVTLNKNQRTTELDSFWMETLLCLIGEAFEEHSEDICGATINIRPKADKLALWTGDASNKESTMAIGRRMKERLGVPANVPVGYEVHGDNISRKGSVARNKYTV